jgi:4-deoxy-L-threo-5-hexosulose-uronate ketol-isomerase
MFEKTYHATHPDMMEGASNEDLRARYLITGLFKPEQVSLNYSHNERMVVGGAAPVKTTVELPLQTEPASAKGKPFLERRELAAINVGDGPGEITVDGSRHAMAQRDGLYIPMGSAKVEFRSSDPSKPARFYLVSRGRPACPRFGKASCSW